MEYKEFLRVILSYRKLQRNLEELRGIGFNLIDGTFNLAETIDEMLEGALRASYTDEGVDWIMWFIYENEYGEKDWSIHPSYKRTEDGEIELTHEAGEVRHGATDENGEPICYSFESTWEFVKQYRKLAD
jgi:hypothetical protein